MLTIKNIEKLLLVLVIFCLAYFNEVWTFQADTASIDQMDIKVENGLLSQAPYHLFWFSQKDDTFKLHYNSLLGNQPLRLYALTNKEKIVLIPPQQSGREYRLRKDYSGSVVAVVPPVQVDLNHDAKNKKVQFSAKIDTLFAQGYDAPRTIFGDPRIPFEVCFKGYKTILLLLNGKPLSNQTVQLNSRRWFGLVDNRIVSTDAAGMLQVNDIRDLRTGINIIYPSRDQTWYIASYRMEAGTMFTKRYLKALTPLAKSLQGALVLAVLLIIGNKVYWWRARSVSSAKAGDRIANVVAKQM